MGASFQVSTIFNGRDRMSPAFNRMSRGANNFGRTLRNIAGPLIAAFSIRQVTRFANESIELFGKQEAAIASANATLQSTGGTVGRTLANLEAQAASLQANTFIGDEAILQGVTAQMLTFTNITESAFDRAQVAVVDVAAKLNGLNTNEENLRSTTIALSKALNDPVSNLGALARSGIQFSDAQTDMIKNLAETNRLAQAQDIILREIETQYGGTANAIAQTSAGMALATQNMIGDAKEVIGKGLAPIKLQLLTIIKDVLPQLIPVFEKVTSGIRAGFEWVIATAPLVAAEFQKWVPVLKVVAPIILGIVAAFTAYATVMKVVTIAQAAYNAVMAASPITWIILGIGALIGIIYLLATNWDMVKEKTVQVWGAITSAVGNAVDWIGAALSGLGAIIMTTLFTPINLIIDGLQALIGILSNLPGKAGAAFSGANTAIQEFQDEINRTMTGTEGAYDFGGAAQQAFNENRDAPNRREAEARQEVSFEGYLNIAGAPNGSTIDSTTRGAPPVRTALMGAQ